MTQPLILHKVALLRVENRSVLFARSADQPEIFYNWGGTVEEGETPEEALMREIWEEGNVRICRSTIVFLKTFSDPCFGKPGVTLQLDCYAALYRGTPTPGHEIAELAWFTTADKDRTTDTGRQVLAWLKKGNFID